MILPTKAYASLFDQLDNEIRHLPSPCTRAALEAAIVTLEQAQPNKTFDADLRESLVQLGLQRKLPIAGGRRGAKAAAIQCAGPMVRRCCSIAEEYLQVERQAKFSCTCWVRCQRLGIRTSRCSRRGDGPPVPGTEKNAAGGDLPRSGRRVAPQHVPGRNRAGRAPT